jgi:hypothetical protein
MNIYEEKAIIDREAAKYHVSPEVIWGIYGNETDFGKNQTTSKSGAKGPTQFLESTAKQYGYPYTNEKSKPVFEKQIGATARYLESLLHSSGTKGAAAYEYAIQGYSGHSYTYSKVLETARKNPLGSGAHEGIEELQGPVGPGEGTEGSTGKAIEKGLEEGPGGGIIKSAEEGLSGINAVGNFFNALGEAKTWLRLAEGLGGLVLIYLGLAELTKSHPVGNAVKSDFRVVTGAVKVVK